MRPAGNFSRLRQPVEGGLARGITTCFGRLAFALAVAGVIEHQDAGTESVMQVGRELPAVRNVAAIAVGDEYCTGGRLGGR